jgi:hypothetical protein
MTISKRASSANRLGVRDEEAPLRHSLPGQPKRFHGKVDSGEFVPIVWGQGRQVLTRPAAEVQDRFGAETFNGAHHQVLQAAMDRADGLNVASGSPPQFVEVRCSFWLLGGNRS